MKRTIFIWQIIGFWAVSLLGVLLHFLYDLSGIKFTALFSAVNESTWEHMKLIFFSILLFALIEYIFIGKNYKNFWCIKLCGTLIGLTSIPVLFYTLNGILGTTPDWVNIAIFFMSVMLSFIYEAKQFINNSLFCKYNILSFIALCLIAVLFGIFTFITPEIPLFQDPVSRGFGIH